MHLYMYWWEIGATFFLVLMTYPHISILLAALCHEKRNHVRYIFVGKFCILKLYFFLGRSTFNSFRTVHSYMGPLTSEEMELNVNWLQNFKLIIFTWQSIDLALIMNAKQLKLFWWYSNLVYYRLTKDHFDCNLLHKCMNQWNLALTKDLEWRTLKLKTISV